MILNKVGDVTMQGMIKTIGKGVEKSFIEKETDPIKN